ARPGRELYGYLAREALGRDPPADRELLRRIALFDHVALELSVALGSSDALDALDRLVRRGLATELANGEIALHGLVREFVRRTWPLDDEEARDVQRLAAAWLTAQGLVEDAVRAHAAAGDVDAAAAVLAAHGPGLLAGGGAEAVLRAAALVPAASRTSATEQVVGEALAALGRFEAALAAFARAAAHTALALAAEAKGGFALAAAHLDDALAAAERANDVLQLCRIRNNRGSVLRQQARFDDAVGELEQAIALSERVAFPPLLGL